MKKLIFTLTLLLSISLTHSQKANVKPNSANKTSKDQNPSLKPKSAVTSNKIEFVENTGEDGLADLLEVHFSGDDRVYLIVDLVSQVVKWTLYDDQDDKALPLKIIDLNRGQYGALLIKTIWIGSSHGEYVNYFIPQFEEGGNQFKTYTKIKDRSTGNIKKTETRYATISKVIRRKYSKQEKIRSDIYNKEVAELHDKSKGAYQYEENIGDYQYEEDDKEFKIYDIEGD